MTNLTNEQLYIAVAKKEGYTFVIAGFMFESGVYWTNRRMAFELIDKYDLDITHELDGSVTVEYWIDRRTDARSVHAENLERAVMLASILAGQDHGKI